MFDYDDILSSDDSDILGSGKTKSSGRVSHNNTPYNNIVQEFVNLNPNVLESMYTHGDIGFIVPMSIRFFKEISKILASGFSNIGSGSYDKALVETLDSMTNNQVTRQARVFECQKFLIDSFHVIGTANQIYLKISQSDQSPTKSSVALLNYLISYLKIMTYIRSKLIEQYYIACGDANVIPDQLVIDYGIIDYANPIYAATDTTYAYRNHHSLGNVEELRVLANQRYDHLSDLITKVIFLTDLIEPNTNL